MPRTIDLSDDIPHSNTAVKGKGLSSHAGNAYNSPLNNSTFGSGAKACNQHRQQTQHTQEHHNQAINSPRQESFQDSPSNNEETTLINYGFFWSPISSQLQSLAFGLHNSLNNITLEDKESDAMSGFVSFGDEITRPGANSARNAQEEPMSEEEVRHWDEFCASYKKKVYSDDCVLSDLSDHDSDLSTLSGYEPDMETEDDSWEIASQDQYEARRVEFGSHEKYLEQVAYLRHISKNDTSFDWQPGSMPTSAHEVTPIGLYSDTGTRGEITTYPPNVNVSSENIKALVHGTGSDPWLPFEGGRHNTNAHQKQLRLDQIKKLANFLPHGLQLVYDDSCTLVHLENVYEPSDANKLLIWLNKAGHIKHVGVWQNKNRMEAEQAEVASVGMLYNKYNGLFWPELDRLKDCLNFELPYVAVALEWTHENARTDSDGAWE